MSQNNEPKNSNEIKPVVKAALVGAGVWTAAWIAPIGIAGVIGLTAAGVVSSFVSDTILGD